LRTEFVLLEQVSVCRARTVDRGRRRCTRTRSA
jgi:hypothetical protein